MLESMHYFKSIFALLIVLPTLALAGPAEEAELADIDQRQANLNLKKDWAKYRLEKKQHECYDKFFTTRCLDQARLEHRQEIKEIRAQEIPMHERQRVLKAILKDEKDAERLKQRNDPLKEEKRSENVKAFEQKQIDRDKREADLAKKRADSERRANENKKATPF